MDVRGKGDAARKRAVTLFGKAARMGALAGIAYLTANYLQIMDMLSGAASGEHDHSHTLNLLSGLAVGMLTGVGRAVLGYFTNIIPGDEIHGVGKPPAQVTLTTPDKH